MGMIYITVVYKVYRYDTFTVELSHDEMAEQFWKGWHLSTSSVPDWVFLLIIYYTYVWKMVLQLRLMPLLGPVVAMLAKLLRELAVFCLFFLLQAFLFAVVGSLLFNYTEDYSSLG